MDYLLFLLALFSGGFMAWGVGANDVANAMGTSVGSKIITIKQAILIAAVFEALGAFYGSGTVIGTIRHDIIQPDFYSANLLILAKGMIAALLASATWLLLATTQGWPVSTTHSIIGAVVGFGLVSQGADNIQWQNISAIALSWITTPIFSGVLGFVMFRIIQKFVLIHPMPHTRASILSGLFIGLMLTLGIAEVIRYLSPQSILLQGHRFWLLAPLAITASMIFFNHTMPKAVTYRERCRQVEKLFGILALFTACAMAAAHGANDVANAIGPLGSVIEILQTGRLVKEASVPLWVLIYGSAGVVLGLSMYGYRIIASVGSNITSLSPSRSFSAQLATAVIVMSASKLGFPVSTTHTLVGAVLGVGFARGYAAVNLSVVRGIFMSWAVTISAGAIFSIIYFTILQGAV